MIDFEQKVWELVSETESNIYDLERMIFTGRYVFLEKDFQILSKQSVVMLYSLWEGFIQEIFTLFLREVDKTTSSYFELKDSFMVSQIEKNFSQFNQYPRDDSAKIFFHTQYFNQITYKKHTIKDQVNLKNNVGLSVLNNLLKIHGIKEIPSYWKDKGYAHKNFNVKDLLDKLLDRRNNTAHGNKIMTNVVIEQAEFDQYKKLIIDLMYELGELFIECINNKIYLKSNQKFL